MKRIAVVRPRGPNLAELGLFNGFADAYAIDFFFAGMPERAVSEWLAAERLAWIRPVKYRAVSDFVPTANARRVLDFGLGIGSRMLTDVAAVMDHEIICVVDPVYAFTGQIAARLRKDQRLVVFKWELIPGRYRTPPWRESMAKQVLTRADAIVCMSEAARSALAEYESVLRAQTVVDVVHPGVSQPALPRVDASGDFRVTTVARLQWQKGIDDLIGAIGILRHHYGISAPLTIIGGGDTRVWRRRAEALKVADLVSLEGAVPGNRIGAFLARTTVYCQPSAVSRSWCEQFGFAVVEAMRAGCPVVSAASGALPEIVGPAARFFPARNAPALAAVLAELYAAPEQLPAMGRALQEFAALRYCPERQSKKLREIIDAL